MKFYTNISRLGNNMLFSGYFDGKRVYKKIKFKPTLYIPTQEKTDWTDLYGNPVRPIKFESLSEMREYKETNGDISNFEIHGDIRPEYQLITGLFPNKIEYDIDKIHIFNFDIETKSDSGFPEPDKADQEIISIAASSSRHKNKYFAWGLGEYDPSIDEEIREGFSVEYFKFDSEVELLKHFIRFWERDFPDILTGWFIKMFDIPYIINRIRKVLGEEWVQRLSPWEKISAREERVFKKTRTYYDIFGIQTLDYMDIFQKFGKLIYGEQESYKLDHIAHVILGKNKVSYEEYGSLDSLYKNDHQKFISYNIRDVSLIDEMDEKTKLMSLTLTLAYKGGVNYSDAFGTTGIWDSFIYRDLNLKKIAIPPQPDSERVDFVGGWVKDVKEGKSEWVTSFDLDSLYPNTMVQYNMSPETLIRKLAGYDVEYFLAGGLIPDEAKENEYTICANGTMFRKDFMGVFPRLIIDLYAERVEAKKKLKDIKQELEKNPNSVLESLLAQYDSLQMAVKILLNSLYGAVGNRHFRYYDLRIAEGITISGQLADKWAERSVNKYLQNILKDNLDRVIAADTDSIYVELKDIVEKAKPSDSVEFVDRFCIKKLIPEIDKGYQELFEYMNGYLNRMSMKREAIADSGIWTGKKHYILNVHDLEGVRYSEPKLKIVGMDTKKSSTPAFAKPYLEEGYKIALLGEEKDIHKLVSKVKKAYYNSRADEIAKPSGVSEVEKWKDSVSLYKTGCPIHVRASLVHNKAVDDLGLEKKYEKIQDGSKIKYIYLKEPNPVKENIIGFMGFMPEEFDLEPFIDYDVQFEKTFVKPLQQITDTLGWSAEKIETLEDFFG